MRDDLSSDNRKKKEQMFLKNQIEKKKEKLFVFDR
jgi:hypothetical protein